jgi:hypothetical protein
MANEVATLIMMVRFGIQTQSELIGGCTKEEKL